jgi:hypothetical protein
MGRFNIVGASKSTFWQWNIFCRIYQVTTKSMHAIETQPVEIIRFVCGQETVLALGDLAVWSSIMTDQQVIDEQQSPLVCRYR